MSIKSTLLYFFLFIALSFCTLAQKFIKINGFTQGTTYSLTFGADNSSFFQKGIDSILSQIDQTFSSYNKNSILNKININQQDVVLNEDFIDLFKISERISKKSFGAFDITVGPLVRAWGFGADNIIRIDTTKIDSFLKITGYKKVAFKKGRVVKENANIKLDFNGIAQGYSVDLLAEFLEKYKVKNYMVEIGGEVRTKGNNERGEMWLIGIDKPTDDPSTGVHELQTIVKISGKAISTSGNYRRFYIKDGKRYAHTINPSTGYPVNNGVLSVSVIADDCTSSDAYDTAFMVLGLKKSLELIKKLKNVEAYFIYTDENGKIQVAFSEGFKKYMDE